MRHFYFWSTVVLLLTAALAGSVSEPGLPPNSHSGPDAGSPLESMVLPEGFRIDLVAAEPLVRDPVAMTVDAGGRLYVAEDGGYPELDGRKGRVVRLRDENGDGRPDERIVFADSLVAPVGLTPWKDGLLVTDGPDLLYLVDEDEDPRADRREVVVTGFQIHSQTGVNSPVYGLDNAIYLASAIGDSIRFPDLPNGPVLRSVRSNLRVQPDSGELEALSAYSQYGHAFDRWGRHLLNSNANHIYMEVLAARYLRRNPDLQLSSATEVISDHGRAPQVYPVTKDPEYQMFTDPGVITSACGITAYDGGLFPEVFRGASFVAEPVHNLVHVDTLAPRGSTLRAGRLYREREFLASTDPRFRPVSTYVGPDGALYVVDFHRPIVDRPKFLSDSVLAAGNLYEGSDKGRIYRITPEEAPKMGWLDGLDLEGAGPKAWVAHLGDQNRWWRRSAQRLLVEHGASGAVPALERTARTGSPVGRLHALWTLEGLGRLSPEFIERALGAGEAGLRENAVRLAERHLEAHPRLKNALLEMIDDPSGRVRFQVAATLGSIGGERAREVRRDLLFENLEDRWIRLALLSSRSLRPEDLLAEAARRLSDDSSEGARSLFEELGRLSGAGRSPEQWTGLTERLARAARRGSSQWWHGPVLSGLADGLAGRSDTLETTGLDRDLLVQAFFESGEADLRDGFRAVLETVGLPEGPAGEEALETARRIATDQTAGADRRGDAARLLALGTPGAEMRIWKALLVAEEPASVQRAAVEALKRVEGPEPAELLLSRWKELALTVREEAVDVFLEGPERARVLLNGVERGTVRLTTIGWPRRKQLMLSDDPAIQERARQLLAREQGARRAVVERYRAALSREGDPAAGRRVFARECSRCHPLEGELGVHFGPDLATVRNRTPSWILTEILRPQRAVAQGYGLWQVRLEDGTSLTGILQARTPQSLTLAPEPGRQVTVSRDRIESLSGTGTSAMPEGFENRIDREEMANLLAFIEGSGGT